MAAETTASAVRWGAFGEARLLLAPLRAAERDTALRVFAETLVRVAGRIYRPRFRSVDALLGRLVAGSGTATTLGGCLVVPDLEGDSALICREPVAADPAAPLAQGIVWDGRWRLSVAGASEGLAEGLYVGALGQTGLRAARPRRPRRRVAAAARLVRRAAPGARDGAGGVLAAGGDGRGAAGGTLRGLGDGGCAGGASPGSTVAPVRPADAGP